MSIPSGGDVAEQIIKVSINGAEQAIKLVGQGAVELMALLKAMFENNKNVAPLGKTRVVNLVKDGHDISAFTIQAKDRKQFEQIANDLKIPFATIKDRTNKEDCNVLFRAVDTARINNVLEKINYRQVDKDGDAKKKIDSLSEEHSLPSSKEKMTQTNTIEMPKDTKEFKQFLIAQNKLEPFSKENRALIAKQAPNARQVMSKQEWAAQGRSVAPNAQKIMVHLPNYEKKSPVLREFSKVPMYDISSTTGESLAIPKKKNEQETEKIFQKLSQDKNIQYDNHAPDKSYYNMQDGVITMSADLDINQKTCLLFREEAHQYLHEKQGVSYNREDSNLLATAIAFRLSEKLEIKNDVLDFEKLTEKLKELGMDEKQQGEFLKELEQGYKELSKEAKVVEIEKDAPQANTQILKKTER